MNEDQNQNQEGELNGTSELEVLKNRARMMGVVFSNNIKVETLRMKIQARLDGTDEQGQGSDQEETETEEVNAIEAMANAALEKAGEKVPERQLTLTEMLQRDQMKLVRCRITNLDPKKKDLPGEVFTVANEYLGTVRKFIPFGEATDEGYHIPFCLYTMLKDKTFLSITSTRDRRTGTEKTSTRYVKEFSIEVMDPLTREELAQLAQAQIAAGSVDSQ